VVTPCARCGERDGTELWCPTGGFGYVHGLGVYWCRRCVLTVQLAEARRLAAQVPVLEGDAV
jgi:hypothetical protein